MSIAMLELQKYIHSKVPSRGCIEYNFKDPQKEYD